MKVFFIKILLIVSIVTLTYILSLNSISSNNTNAPLYEIIKIKKDSLHYYSKNYLESKAKLKIFKYDNEFYKSFNAVIGIDSTETIFALLLVPICNDSTKATNMAQIQEDKYYFLNLIPYDGENIQSNILIRGDLLNGEIFFCNGIRYKNKIIWVDNFYNDNIITYLNTYKVENMISINGELYYEK